MLAGSRSLVESVSLMKRWETNSRSPDALVGPTNPRTMSTGGESEAHSESHAVRDASVSDSSAAIWRSRSRCWCGDAKTLASRSASTISPICFA